MKLRHRIGLWLMGKDGKQSLSLWRLAYREGFNHGLQSYAVPTDEDQARFDQATAKAKAEGTSLYQDMV